MSDRPVGGDPLGLRLLLLPYPPEFRRDFGRDIRAFVTRQRAEARYATRVVGAVRFWWDAGSDALANGIRLRLASGRARVGRWRSGGSHARSAEGTRLYDEHRGGGRVDGFSRDLRYAGRSLLKSPGFCALFVTTLGLGIGANTAIFSAVDGILLRSLPHRNGDRLVYLRQSAALVGLENALFSVPTIDDYRQGVPSFDAVAEFSALTFTMLGQDEPRRVRAGIVTGNFFTVLGLDPVAGRTFDLGDDGENAEPVVVLTHEYWQRAFGADPGVLGASVTMNGRSLRIVGVLEPAPPYPERTDLYVNMVASPHHLSASMNHDREHRMTEVFARLAPGASLAGARAEIDEVTSRIHRDHPDAFDPGAGYHVSATLLKDQLTRRARPTLLLLLATGAFVLVIACANLANLALSRFLRREHEFAIRASLGGSRGNLRRQLLAESALLSMGGAVLGLAMASLSLGVLVAYASRFTVRAAEITLDGWVFAFALAVAAGASCFFAWIPRLPGGDSIAGAIGRADLRTTGGTRHKTLQRGLVVAQVAVSFVLLVGAGLLARTLLQLQDVDPGFDTETVLSMDISASATVRSPEEVKQHYAAILDDVRRLPGVTAAAMTNHVPLAPGSGGFTTQFRVRPEGFEPAPGAPEPRADFRVVTPDFFRTLGTPVLQGREFLDTDVAGGPLVAVITESMARAYFPGQDPIGQRIAWADDVLRYIAVGDEWRTVVGVVGDLRSSPTDEGPYALYTPYEQIPWTGSLVVRSGSDPTSLIAPIRRLIRARDPNQPVDNVVTLARLSEDTVAPQRLNTVLLGSFALLALIIAAVGIGGVLAFNVGSRSREFGIRGALGASRHQVRSGVLREGAQLAGVGLLVGGLGALVLTRFLSGLLFGVPVTDPATYAAVCAVLVAVALGASWVPAWRASRVDPLEALRAD